MQSDSIDQQQMQAYVQQQQQQRLLAYQALLARAYQADEETLRAALTSKSGAERFAAAYVIGERQLPWQSDLIERLTDSRQEVRMAARRSLILLSYFALQPEASASNSESDNQTSGPPQIVDFGPKPAAGVAAQKDAAKKWTEWWSSRRSNGETKSTELRGNRDPGSDAVRKEASTKQK